MSQTAELFTPGVDRDFYTRSAMKFARVEPAMALLSDGRIVIAGGSCETQDPPDLCNSVELFDPRIGTFVVSGQLHSLGGLPDLEPMADGRLMFLQLQHRDSMVFGRHGVDPVHTEIFDPSTGVVLSGPPVPHMVDAATSLADGRVLLTGQWDVSAGAQGPEAGTSDRWAAVFDPGSGETEELDDSRTDRRYWAGVLLPDGRVLLIERLSQASVDAGTANAIDIFSPQ